MRCKSDKGSRQPKKAFTAKKKSHTPLHIVFPAMVFLDVVRDTSAAYATK